MADVMHLLDDCWGVDMNDGLETCRVGKFLLDVFDGWRLMNDELRNMIKKLDANGNGNGKIDIKEFASMILKTNDNDLSEMNSEFNEALFSPSLTTNEEFIVSLEEYRRDHRAVTLESQQESMFQSIRDTKPEPKIQSIKESHGDPKFQSIGDAQKEPKSQSIRESKQEPKFQSIGDSQSEPIHESHQDPKFQSVGDTQPGPKFQSIRQSHLELKFHSIGDFHREPKFQSIWDSHQDPKFQSVDNDLRDIKVMCQPEDITHHCQSLAKMKNENIDTLPAPFWAPSQSQPTITLPPDSYDTDCISLHYCLHWKRK